jgi:hypothetical protein
MHQRLIALIALIISSLAAPTWATTIDTVVTDTNAQVKARVTAPRGVALGSHDEDQRYASQEAKSPDAMKYRGGDVIVISATALVIILLVVVILILI